MGFIVAAVLAVGFVFEPMVITGAIALIAAVAVYELLHNAAGIKDKLAVSGGCAFTFIYIIGADNSLIERIASRIPKTIETAPVTTQNFYNYWSYCFSGIFVLYLIFE
jgi:type IV secretory pathway VirB6-like protein